MKSGMFPGQQEALRELARKGLKYEGVARRQRRMFLGMCFGTAAVGAGAYWAGGRSRGEEPTTPPAPPDRVVDPKILEQVPTAHDLALGSEATLRAQYAPFLLIHDAIGGDATTWLGVQRLACSCARPDDELDGRIARRLLTSIDACAPPPSLRPTFDLLGTRLNAFRR